MNTQIYQLKDWIKLEDFQIENQLSEKLLLKRIQDNKIQVFWKIPKNMETIFTSRAYVMATKSNQIIDGYDGHRVALSTEQCNLILQSEPVVFVCLQQDHSQLKQSYFRFSLPYLEQRPEFTYFPRATVDSPPNPLFDIYVGAKLEMRETHEWISDQVEEIFKNGSICYPIFSTSFIQNEKGLLRQQYDEQDDCSIFTENIFLVRERGDSWSLAPAFAELKIGKSELYILESKLADLLPNSKENNINNIEYLGDEIFLSSILKVLVKLAKSEGSIISGVVSCYPNLDEVKKYLKNELNLSGKQEKVALQIIKRRKSTNFDPNKASIGFSEELRVVCSLAKESWEPLMNIAVQIKNSYKGPKQELSLVDFFKGQYPNGFFIGSFGEVKKITAPSSKQLEQSLIERNVNQEFAKTLAGMMQIS